MLTVYSGNGKLAKLLLERHVAIEARDFGGGTALSCLAAARLPEIVRRLMSYGAGLKLVSSSVQSPVMQAVIGGQFETADLPLQQGVNADFHDLDGRTSLFWALENENESMIPLLLEGATVEVKDQTGSTPISTTPNIPTKGIIYVRYSGNIISILHCFLLGRNANWLGGQWFLL